MRTSFFNFLDAFPNGFMSSTALRFDGGCEWLGIVCTSTMARDMQEAFKAAQYARSVVSVGFGGEASGGRGRRRARDGGSGTNPAETVSHASRSTRLLCHMTRAHRTGAGIAPSPILHNSASFCARSLPTLLAPSSSSLPAAQSLTSHSTSNRMASKALNQRADARQITIPRVQQEPTH